MYTIHILSKCRHKRTSMYQGYYQNDFCIHCGAKFLCSNMNQIYWNRSTGRVAQWIRRPTSNRKIVGSIPIVVNFAMKQNSKNQKCRGTQDNSTLRVGFEPTREDPIWFRVKRLNHSAIAANELSNDKFRLWFGKEIASHCKVTLRVGFEPTREDPIRFQV